MGSKPPHRKKGASPGRGKQKPPSKKPGHGKPSVQPGAQRASASALRVRKVPHDEAWELVHPRCARDRAEDLEEVRKMIDAGEIDVAEDECRWLLSGCSDCLEAHRILGEIAISENDLPLARGHFGYAFRLGEKALAQAGRPAPLPYRLAANQGFLESAKGLAWSLRELGKRDMAREVVDLMLHCDPSDPLGVRSLLDQQS